jgi:WD40 repeat protein
LHRKHAEALTAARLIAMAHSAWLMDRQDEARRLLDECPVEHRTAEWANLHALGRARQKSLHGVSPAGQQHVFFSSTGKYFGITHFSHGGDIPIYDSDAGNLHMRLRERRVECAAFGPDDRTLAVVTSGRASEPAERKLVVWDLATRTRLREVLLEDRAAGRMSFINSVISGSQVLAWVSPGLEPRSERELPFRDVVVWDAAAGRVRHTLSAAPRFAYGLAITPDGRRLAIAQPPDALVVVDPQTGSQVAVLACEVQPVSRIALGDDGLLLAWSIGGAGFSNEVRVWNLETGKQSAHVALHHRALWIDLSADGRLLAVACADSSVQLFATSGGRHLATLRGHAMGVVSVAFSPTSQRLVSADGEGVALLWDISPWSAGSGR